MGVSCHFKDDLLPSIPAPGGVAAKLAAEGAP